MALVGQFVDEKAALLELNEAKEILATFEKMSAASAKEDLEARSASSANDDYQNGLQRLERFLMRQRSDEMDVLIHPETPLVTPRRPEKVAEKLECERTLRRQITATPPRKRRNIAEPTLATAAFAAGKKPMPAMQSAFAPVVCPSKLFCASKPALAPVPAVVPFVPMPNVDPEPAWVPEPVFTPMPSSDSDPEPAWFSEEDSEPAKPMAGQMKGMKMVFMDQFPGIFEKKEDLVADAAWFFQQQRQQEGSKAEQEAAAQPPAKRRRRLIIKGIAQKAV